MKDENGEVLISSNISHVEANRLRSALTKTVPRVWVLVMNTKDPSLYNVFIANDWGGRPSSKQIELASNVQNTMNNDVVVDTLRDDEFVDVTDDVQFSL